jgi:imidazolonepropionase-like amidohydrolase
MPIHTDERFSVVANGEIIGYVRAATSAGVVTIDFAARDNGRGPQYHELLTLSEKGYPLDWRINGTAEVGNAVHEHFSVHNRVATWASGVDRGSVPLEARRFYVASETSPWAFGAYARALLQQPDRRLDVLPKGTLELQTLRQTSITGSGATVPITIYALSGLELAPIYVALDAQGLLFAHLSAESALTVREGFEQSEGVLRQLTLELQTERQKQLQATLAHRYDLPVRIKNVRIFDPVKKLVGDPTTVTVFRGRISGVADSPNDTLSASDAVVIDGQGDTIVPGLHDMHSHNTIESGLLYLASGVTTTRDMGNYNDVLLKLTQGIDRGELAGPRIVRNGFLEGRSPYSARLGFVADTLDAALSDVRWYASRGYFQIKIYNSMNPTWVKPIALEAHRLGMGVTGHVPAFTNADQMIRDGYDEVTHINQIMLEWLLAPGEDTRSTLRITAMRRARNLDLNDDKVRATIELMKARHTAHDPTLVNLERLHLSRDGVVQPGDQAYLDHMPIGFQRSRMRAQVPIETRDDDLAYAASFVTILKTARLFYDNGIHLLPGTDDPSNSGLAIHRDLELYAQAGIPMGDVLALDTLACEQYLGRAQDLGSIERGKLADLILVQGDPVQDISALRRVKMVMKGELTYFPSDIYEALHVRPFAAPPVIHGS